MSISKYLPYLPIEEQLKQENERQKAVFYMQHPLQIGKTVRTMSNERKQSKLDELIQKYCPEGVEYKKLGEIAIDIFRGSGIKRDQVTEDGIPCVCYGEIYTTYGIWFDSCLSHTKIEYVQSPKYFS